MTAAYSLSSKCSIGQVNTEYIGWPYDWRIPDMELNGLILKPKRLHNAETT